jgi:DNA uptake protein ComE-like DNA-binding protein
MKKESWDNWFYISRREAIGYAILLVIILLSIFFPALLNWLSSEDSEFSQRDIALLDSLVRHFEEVSEVEKNVNFFPFDPNVLSQDSLVIVGFRPEVARRINNYRSRGGNFTYKEDLLKIYGLDSSLYYEIDEFIKLPSRGTEQPDKNLFPVDINKVGKETLLDIYGIGEVFAGRIISYRNNLGGYITKSQFDEIYDLDSIALLNLRQSTFVANDFIPKKVNINTLTSAQLEEHPYISRSLANDISNFRTLNGSIQDTSQLKNFRLMTADVRKKLFPYLEF